MKVALILGDSPIIQTIEKYIPNLLFLYPSIGINRIIRKFQTTKHIFVDDRILPVTNEFPNMPVITIKQNGSKVNKPKELKELINVYSPHNNSFVKTINTDNIEVENSKGELLWYGFSHDYAISYLIRKGYDMIVLVGTADFIDGNHYVANQEYFQRSNRLQNYSKQYIEYVNENIIPIYTINPNPIINIPTITIEELITGVLKNANRTNIL
jgi:hypothetical protein